MLELICDIQSDAQGATIMRTYVRIAIWKGTGGNHKGILKDRHHNVKKKGEYIINDRTEACDNNKHMSLSHLIAYIWNVGPGSSFDIPQTPYVTILQTEYEE